jgi:hypothetical protein
MEKLKKVLKKIKNQPKKKIYLILCLILIVVAVGFFSKRLIKIAPKMNYEVAIVVNDQYNSDPTEDAKNSLKTGDVLVVQEENHNWSKTEEISYLIIKMNLTEDQKQKLTAPAEREIKFEELSAEEQQRINDEKKRAEEAGEEYREEPRKETLRARAYQIDMEEFTKKGFKRLDLLSNQPFQKEVYDWGIIIRK